MKIGYCCGVFDLGHIGHINFLRKAKSYCDKLIVGIISDAAIKKQKGNNRPIMDIDEREQWVEALEIADSIYIMVEFNPTTTLRYIYNNYSAEEFVFIKGRDQTHVDETYALENGWIVINLSRTEGISTSEIIKRIQKC